MLDWARLFSAVVKPGATEEQLKLVESAALKLVLFGIDHWFHDGSWFLLEGYSTKKNDREAYVV